MVTDLATTLVVVLLGGIAAGQWLRLRRVNDTCGRLRAELVRAQWLDWWVRNAAEMTPLDPARPYFVRLAYAAQLAPDLQAFRRDCDMLTMSPEAPESLREAARAYVAELSSPRVPWEVWVEETGKPPHASFAIESAYREVIASPGKSPARFGTIA
jgi:hypothetical protein